MRAAYLAAKTFAPVAAAILPAASRPRPNERAAAKKQSGRLAGLEYARGDAKAIGIRRHTPVRFHDGPGFPGVAPGEVGRNDQRGDLSGRPERGLDRVAGRAAEFRSRSGRVDVTRNAPRECDDVGRQRRIVLQVLRRVLADDVHHRREGLPRIVEVSEAVCQPGARGAEV